jgi:glucose-6-phosphate isomerase
MERFLNYSKNIITRNYSLLLELANEMGLKKPIADYFEGDLINQTRRMQHCTLH